jgi:hypothetical protein
MSVTAGWESAGLIANHHQRVLVRLPLLSSCRACAAARPASVAPVRWPVMVSCSDRGARQEQFLKSSFG